MGEQGKFYNLLKGINYGSPLWFSTPLYIGGVLTCTIDMGKVQFYGVHQPAP